MSKKERICKHQHRWAAPVKCEKKGHIREGKLCPTVFFDVQELCRDYEGTDAPPVDAAGY